ncbi:hypothetical protein BDF14DRAFT_1885763 [Spinellus fusiger]|nr:hypothetical protein BDF14DRAFT_1885763 [Spinellus fusiger]
MSFSTLFHQIYSHDNQSQNQSLPPEVVQLIIKWLPRSDLPMLAGISKNWYKAAMPLLYQHVVIYTRYHWSVFLNTLHSNNAQWTIHTRTLVLRKSPILRPAGNMYIKTTYPVEPYDRMSGQLRGYVRLERIPTASTGLETIETPAYGTKMEKENYPEVDVVDKESEWLTLVTDQDMASVIELCPYLQSLDISGCELVGPKTFSALQKNQKPLVGLWVGLVRSLSNEELVGCFESRKEALRHLDISFCYRLTIPIIEYVISTWGANLTHLRLNSLYAINGDTVKVIAKSCPHLRLLHLTRCWQIDSNAIRLLGEYTKQLSYLSVAFLNRADAPAILFIASKLYHLRWMDITSCGIPNSFKKTFIDMCLERRRQLGWVDINFYDSDVDLL